MPYRSDKQRKFMHAQHPEIAKRWDNEPKTMEYVKGRDDARHKTAEYVKGRDDARPKEMGDKVINSNPRRNARRAAPNRSTPPKPNFEPSQSSRESTFTDFMKNNKNGYNPYAAGNKVYGGGRSAPNVGPTSSREGYLDRDARGKMRRNALLRRMKAGQQGKYNSSDWLRKSR
jgi:hypothetical protein